MKILVALSLLFVFCVLQELIALLWACLTRTKAVYVPKAIIVDLGRKLANIFRVLRDISVLTERLMLLNMITHVQQVSFASQRRVTLGGLMCHAQLVTTASTERELYRLSPSAQKALTRLLNQPHWTTARKKEIQF